MPSARIIKLREKAASLPLCPGVYLMKDSEGRIIYVGKSRHLKNRVSSYFVETDHGIKTARMVSQVADFDTILCDTEMEALTLENVLIKQHSPRYNIKLKDAKSYPFIHITDEAWPRAEVTRTRGTDKGAYFGPYRSAATAYAAIETVSSILSLPTCHRKFPRDIGKERPCLYLQMGRCCGPCVPNITNEDYLLLMKSAAHIFEGNTRAVEAELKRRMFEASDKEQYELAAQYRNNLEALKQLSEKQKVVTDDHVERDVFALYEAETQSVLAVLQIRCGKLLHKTEYAFAPNELTEATDLVGLLLSYYENATPPKEILLDRHVDEEEKTALSELLSERANYRVLIKTPQRGTLKRLCDMAKENAKHHAETKAKASDKAERTLAKLASLLSLEVLPTRIEAYDISNLGQEHMTCSMVVFEDGAPKKADYRMFRIKTVEGTDDYAAMKEALSRRLAHIGDGTQSLGTRPDLILLDGGVGHVHTILPLLAEMGLDIPLFGMVKDEFHKTRCLTDGMQEVSISNQHGVYQLIYALQEEVHRFAVKSMMGAKRKTLRHSSLENIPGIGPAKAGILLKAFGSLTALKQADVDTLSAISGITQTDALRIIAYFQKLAQSKADKNKKK